MKPGARPTVPTASRNQSGTLFSLNNRALQLLTQEGEGYVAVTRAPDGSISIHPLLLPTGALGVVKIIKPVSGAPRVSISERSACCYKPGARYRCRWDDVAEKLVVTFEEA